MKKVIVMFMGLVLLSVCLFAQPPDTLWTRMYGDSEREECNSIQQTSDGGYILAGFTGDPYNNSDMFVVRTDSIGDTLWTRTYDGTENDVAYSVQQTLEGGFVFAGHAGSYWTGNSDFYLVKTDANGDTLWTRTYGGTRNGVCYSMLVTQDSGYVLAGYTDSFGSGRDDMYLVKVDMMGNLEWQQTFGDSLDDVCCSVQRTNDGGYILGGGTGGEYPYYGWYHDIYLVKTDSMGNMEWQRTIDIGSWECCNSIQQTYDGGFILGGYTDVSYYDGSEMLLAKVDHYGCLQWVQIYDYGWDSGDRGMSVLQTYDGGYILGGYSEIGCCRTFHSCRVIKTNALGDREWEFSAGPFEDDRQVCNDILQIGDSSYVFGGWKEYEVSLNYNMYLVKLILGSVSNVSDKSAKMPSEFHLFPAYPNPFNASTVISYSLLHPGMVSLTIHNILGRKVATLIDGVQQTGTHKIIWDASDVSSGIYFASLQSQNQTKCIKMILMK